MLLHHISHQREIRSNPYVFFSGEPQMDVPRFQAQALRFQDGERWKCREAGEDDMGRPRSLNGVVFFDDL